MSTMPDYINYQLDENEIIVRKRVKPVYNITKGIPWITQKWSEMQPYLLIGKTYLM